MRTAKAAPRARRRRREVDGSPTPRPAVPTATAAQDWTIGDDRSATPIRHGLRLLRLVNSLLDASRPEAAVLESTEPIDLAEFTAAMANRFRPAFQRARLRLRINCPPLPQRVSINREQWATIVSAVLTHTLNVTLRGTVKLGLQWAGRSVRLSISTSGRGTGPRSARRPGASAATRRHTRRGSDDGMARLKKFVHAAGGELAVHRTADGHTTLMVWLPIDRRPAAQRHLAAARSLASVVLDARSFLADALRWFEPLEHAVVRVGADSAIESTNVTRQEWIRQLLASQEAERRHIAMELHDTIAQDAAAIVVGLKGLNAMLPSRNAQLLCERLMTMADNIGRDTHGLALGLRPAALDDIGLEKALASHVEDWSARTGVQAAFHARGVGTRLPADVETTTYRIAQEALANVVKHAAARNVSVVIDRSEDALTLIVEDDGIGLRGEATRARKGLGLTGMKERAALVDGTLEIESTPGRGTSVFLRIPVRASERTAHA